VADDELGPLAARVPEGLRGSTAYHVPQPPRVIAKLDANELPFGLPPELRAQLQAALAEVSLERYPDPRAARLRALIASQLGVSGDQLVFGNGSDELIAALCAAFAGPILYPVPSFVYYKLAAIARGLPQVEVPLSPRFDLDEPALLRAIETHRPSVVFLALPNNPTGTLWRPGFALELAARHRDTVIVSTRPTSPTRASPTSRTSPRTQISWSCARCRRSDGRPARRLHDLVARDRQRLEKVRPPTTCRRSISAPPSSSSSTRPRGVRPARPRSWPSGTPRRGADRPRPRCLPERGEPPPRQVRRRPGDVAAPRGGRIVVRSFGSAGPLASCLRITVGTPTENAALLAALPA